MAIITPSLLTALNTGYRREFQSAYDAQLEESFYKKFATVIPSTTSSNTYGWLGDFPALREWIGSRVVKDMAAHGYELTNRKFESTVGVPRTAIEDDSYGVYKPLMATMGQAAAEHPDVMLSDLIAAATATLCYDGQYFLDPDHPVTENVDGTGAVTNVSNFVDGAGPLWLLLDTRKPLKPFIFQERTKPELTEKTDPKTSDDVFDTDQFKYGIRYRCNAGFGFWQMAYGSKEPLTAASFEAARQAMRLFKADGGRPLGIKPNLCLVHPNLESAAEKLFKKAFIDGGDSNEHFNAVEVVVSAWLQ
ncbi:MAG: Mu-like prophage major head subunit gpT family protein [Rhodobacter sp.]|nr:Mu-like prophage major head subunit gpT family protein [Rhodobacter sp.]